MEIVENYIYVTKKKKRIIIHSLLPFDDFVTLLDALFDADYVDITEVSPEEFNNLYLSTDCHVYTIDRQTFDGIARNIIPKK